MSGNESARLARKDPSPSTRLDELDAAICDSVPCPVCGRQKKESSSEQFLSRLGITEEMLNNLKTQLQEIDVEDYLYAARGYLKESANRAETYVKENPGKVAAGVACLAIGVSLIRSQRVAMAEVKDQFRQLELRQALQGRKYPLDEVLRELDVPA